MQLEATTDIYLINIWTLISLPYIHNGYRWHHK